MKILSFFTIFLFINSSFAADSKLGIGAIIGSPLGISSNYKLKGNSSVDGAIGVGMASKKRFNLRSSLLYHKPESLKAFGQVLGWFYGAGAVVKLVDEDGETELKVGPRASLGAIWDFPKALCDLFIEGGVSLILIPKLATDAGLSIGARYYF